MEELTEYALDYEFQSPEETETVNEELMDFDRAYRIFLRDNPECKSWYEAAVKVFCKKRIQSQDTLSSWQRVLNSYRGR